MAMQSNVPEWGAVQPAGGTRCLPVYLLLDTSSSMEGAPIQSVHEGLGQFQNETSRDQFARDVVKVGVITFASDAQLVTGGLVPIAEFQPPALVASGVTRLDLAFKVLVASMDRDVTRGVVGGQKGDFRPVVFVLTDGSPTNEEGYTSDALWRPARDAVTNRPKGKLKPSLIVSVGCGPNVDDGTLKEISTGTAFKMGTSQAAFAALFQYITASIVSSVQPGASLDDTLRAAGGPPPASDLYRVP
ncbi:MAG TPA: VWA domain-containing protein [Anaerolineae bacterium]|nr:VWA domain-containing protein [Anaerolineae bacterium]HOR00645.1 VWA domain-containing protein [Anaerolineae bacterium]HPL29417.1 VWA domain-containing protein [Anaerolineae bacterium]